MSPSDRHTATATSSRPKRPWRKRLSHAAAVSVAFATIAGLGFGGALVLLERSAVGARSGPATPTIPVAAAEIPRVDGYTATRTFTGRIMAQRSADLGFERGGRVDRVLVDDGAAVAAGDVLATLDGARLQAERTRMAAELAEVRARLDNARRTADRQATLVARGHASGQTHDDARFAVASLEAEELAVLARLDANAVDLDQTQLIAPYDGIVTARAIDEGAIVAAGTPILTLIESSAPEIRVGVPVRLAERVMPGDLLPVVVSGVGSEAEVAAVLPDLATETRTVTVVLQLQDRMTAPSGELATLEMAEAVEADGRWVPIDALSEGLRGLWTVYFLEPVQPDEADTDDPQHPLFVVRQAAVEVLQPEVDRAFVRGTLPDAALIVSAGVHRIVPGQHVHLAPDRDNAAMTLVRQDG